jgi:hypothetical protein
MQERRKVDTTLDDQKRFLTEKKRGGSLRLLKLDLYSLKLDLYSLKLDKYTLGEDKYTLGEDLYSLKLDKYTLDEAEATKRKRRNQLSAHYSNALRSLYHVHMTTEAWAQDATANHGLGSHLPSSVGELGAGAGAGGAAVRSPARSV